MWGVQLVLLQSVHHADRSSMSYLSRPNFWSATNLWDLSWPNFVCVTVAISGTKLLKGLVTAQFLFTCHGPVPYTGISDRELPTTSSTQVTLPPVLGEIGIYPWHGRIGQSSCGTSSRYIRDH